MMMVLVVIMVKSDDAENDGDGKIPEEDSKEPQQRLKLSARAAEEGSPDH